MRVKGHDMGKQSKHGKNSKHGGQGTKGRRRPEAEEPELTGTDGQASDGDAGEPDGAPTKLGRRRYEKELERLQGELVQLQQWVVASGTKVCIVFEGRDGAGKGGVIKRLTERLSPRVFRVVALPAPTERERSQMYFQRYMSHLPAGGEVVIFDRSWYNRAGVERVMGFCSEEEVERFLDLVPTVEKAMVTSGIIVLKYWLEVSQAEQTRRLTQRIDDGRKTWKLTPMDLRSYSHWYDYSRARDEMLAATDTSWAPWYVADSNDKKRARLNIISHLLDQIPYEAVPAPPVELPERQSPGGYQEPHRALHLVPGRF
jgi:polyphosphate kinase 2